MSRPVAPEAVVPEPADNQAWRPGAYIRIGLGIAILALAVDQASKLWLIHGFDLAERGRVALAPWFDLVLTWNTGVSYGWFSQETTLGRWFLVIFKLAAIVFLSVWLWRAESKLTAASLGLIIGGAIGNVIDRFLYGAVADFAFFHIEAINFYWYVFNLADVAIVFWRYWPPVRDVVWHERRKSAPIGRHFAPGP